MYPRYQPLPGFEHCKYLAPIRKVLVTLLMVFFSEQIILFFDIIKFIIFLLVNDLSFYGFV